MRSIVLLFSIAPLFGQPAAAQVDPAAPKEAVTLEINADLLRRAREKNVDLSFVMEKQLEAVLGPFTTAVPVSQAPRSHRSLLAASFDSLEDIVFAPLKIDQNTPVASVRRICQSMIDSLDQLVAHAETRKSMALPTTLEEAKALDQYLAGRFQAFGNRMGKDANGIQAATRIMEAKCPDLKPDKTVIQQAMGTALGKYGPLGWCRATMRKPQAQWSMEDGVNFAKHCQGVKLN